MAAELNEIQNAKLELRFRQMDRDGSGFLQCCDYEAMADRLITASGVPIASESAVRMRRYALGLWEALATCQDTGGGGRISRPEWIASVAESIIGRDSYHRVIGPMMRHAVGMFDPDGDGVIGVGEYCELFACFGLSRPDAQAVFQLIDADGDGRVSVEEIDGAVHEFFTSPDGHATGSRVFGPVAAVAPSV